MAQLLVPAAAVLMIGAEIHYLPGQIASLKVLAQKLSNVFTSESNETAPQTGGDAKPTNPSDILAPNGVPVGENVGGAKPGVQTVPTDKLTEIIDKLKGSGATLEPERNYPGDWYSLPNGQGGFGVRDSKANGRTLDVNIPSVPDVTKVHEQ